MEYINVDKLAEAQIDMFLEDHQAQQNRIHKENTMNDRFHTLSDMVPSTPSPKSSIVQRVLTDFQDIYHGTTRDPEYGNTTTKDHIVLAGIAVAVISAVVTHHFTK